MSRLNILVFAKLNRPINRHLKDFIVELHNHANVVVWEKDGWGLNHVLKALKGRGFSPNFIFYYDFVYRHIYAPKIYGLGWTNLPKGVYYIDLQTQTSERREFIKNNRIDLIFSPSKDFFFRTLPEFKDKFRWLPFSNNPDIFKDWHLKKDIDILLMGRVKKEMHPFRTRVIERFKDYSGFVYHQHPFDMKNKSGRVYTGEEYAKEINRAKIFITSGTKYRYPVAKYFEVPACNTLLMAKGNKDLKELGFISGQNFVECTDDNFYDLAMYYLENDKERERIARNGYNLVHSRHTNSIRAKEFIATIERYLKTGRAVR
ncbi:MAG: glycosyltransferase [Clostridiales bacterium]|jgi:hypothetical protein|nr:glycosyltransferase [Clostridiales bacterium]HOC08576.1 glycosyltransferase [Bacillota bacterium]HOO12096.1 glycosyltransferase [Bacillota bacterium]